MPSISKSERVDTLIANLSDGEWYSGEQLGQLMGISRAAVWKYVKILESMGIEFESVRGKGYRIPGGLDLLSSSSIERELSIVGFERLFLFKEIDSTNQFLLNKIDAGEAEHGDLCLAEYQTAGRGRRGRAWVSPFGKNIYCSFTWFFEQGMASLDGLSLVVGISLQKVLSRFANERILLKWPNDLLVANKKLAGILLEARGDLVDSSKIVVGFGLNHEMPALSVEEITQPWVDLDSVCSLLPSRNELIVEILKQVAIDFELFLEKGFTPFVETWNQKDAFIGEEISLEIGSKIEKGIAKGVDEKGALCIEQEGSLRKFYGGEISLRMSEK